MQSTINDIPAELISAIQRNDCIAFIGAGLSKECDYKDSEQLTNRLADTIGKDQATIQPESWPEIAQEAWEKSADSYYDILREEYSNDGSKKPYSAMHTEILQTPFLAYFTTNFDNCIENAANTLQKEIRIQSYPSLDITKLREGNARMLAHIHGRIEDEQKNLEVRNTVLTSRQYEEAYDPNRNFLHSFLQQTFSNYTIVFIGYNLISEAPIKQLLQTCRTISINKGKPSGTLATNHISHFIISPEIWKEDRDSRQHRRREDIEQKEEAECSILGVRIMRYKKSSGTHNPLFQLLIQIKGQSLSKKLKESTLTLPGH